MQRFYSLFLTLFLTFLWLPVAKSQKDIEADTIASLDAGTKECNVVQDYCYGIDDTNVQFKGFMVSHGVVTIAAVIHEAALGLHAQNETAPFYDPDAVIDGLQDFIDALQAVLTAIIEKQAVFTRAGFKKDATDNLAFLVGKLDFFADELAITMPKSYRDTVNDAKNTMDRAVENAIKAFTS